MGELENCGRSGIGHTQSSHFGEVVVYLFGPSVTGFQQYCASRNSKSFVPDSLLIQASQEGVLGVCALGGPGGDPTSTAGDNRNAMAHGTKIIGIGST